MYLARVILLAVVANLICAHAARAIEGVPLIREFTREGIHYRILIAKPEQIRVVWKDGSGEQLGTFAAADAYLRQLGSPPLALMNGGIFEPRGIPSGLLIQDNQVLHPINRRAGKGNFYLEPNGVFSIAGKTARIIATADFPEATSNITYAVQSGPLLLRNGQVHPAFNANSSSRLHRNGVGVDRSGNVVLAISRFDSPIRPNLHQFAELFRALDCADALFLDGDLSMLATGKEMRRPGNHFGSIIAVVAASK